MRRSGNATGAFRKNARFVDHDIAIESRAIVVSGTEASMARNLRLRSLVRTLIFLSFGLALDLAGAHSSFAACGAYCEVRQARAICHHAVGAQGLKVRERDAEFEKCKVDPLNYSGIEELADTELSFD
jgi:hypothetical protein